MTQKSVTRTCSIEGCERSFEAKGYCHTHYERFRKYGDARYVQHFVGEGATKEARFWNRVSKANHPQGCWEWTAGCHEFGYGLAELNIGGVVLRNAHRVSWYYSYGTIPAHYVLHTCDNPKCVNPDHLFEGTHLENMQDMVEKGRGHLGSKHGMAKLTEADIPIIRRAYANNEGSYRFLADMFGVTSGTIANILQGKTWRHV